MKTVKNSINRYHDSLFNVHHALNDYSNSVGKLFDSVKRIDHPVLQQESSKWIALAANNVTQIQQMISQKNLLISPESSRQYEFSTLTDLSLYSTLWNHSVHFKPKQRNMTSYYLKSVLPNQSWIQTKSEPPLRPWLSQKVYRQS